MSTKYFLSFCLLLTYNMVLHCTSASVHNHKIDTSERESDGSYRMRDHDHFSDAEHHSEFDHEAILGSVKEAEEFDKLSPEESKQRLGQLLPKMDLNGDKYIDRDELKKWILNSFVKLSREEAVERMKEVDADGDGAATWSEYVRDAFGVDHEREASPDDVGDTGMLLREEREMWTAADLDQDGKLSIDEFEVFTNPEEHESMQPYLVKQTMREKDSNNDGLIDFNEYLGDRGAQQDREWVVSEKDKFEVELDADKDGVLNAREVHTWVIPDNTEIALEEVDHLFASADSNGDDRLSYDEIIDKYEVFVGSEATDYGDLLGEHFDDEL